jgi:hypothetical protein
LSAPVRDVVSRAVFDDTTLKALIKPTVHPIESVHLVLADQPLHLVVFIEEHVVPVIWVIAGLLLRTYKSSWSITSEI